MFHDSMNKVFGFKKQIYTVTTQAPNIPDIAPSLINVYCY